MSHTETEGYQLPLGSDRDLPLGRIDFHQPCWRPQVQGEPTLSERMRQLTPLDFTWPSPLVTKVKLLHPKAKVPTRSHSTDVGWDVYAVKDQCLVPHVATMVETGIAIQPPPGKWYQGETRSSQAKISCCIFGGIIDPPYRGEVKALIYNGSDEPYWIHEGDRIMQLVERDCPVCSMVKADELDYTVRGEKGLGSTGR